MSSGGTVTLLFTDLVGSTEMLVGLGDEQAEVVRRSHFALLRAAISGTGHEVKNLGDGLMVVFDSAVDAVACAVSMQQLVHQHNASSDGPAIGIRVGLNVGEPIRDEGDFFGMAVVLAKRICDAAEGGQILASHLVRELVGSRGGFDFGDPWQAELKGLSTPLAICEVAWEAVEAQPLALPGALGGTTRIGFVGRGPELTALEEEWRRAKSVPRPIEPKRLAISCVGPARPTTSTPAPGPRCSNAAAPSGPGWTRA